jgi:Neuraminidase (sialidase)
MDLVCTGSQLKGDGRAEGTFANPETFSGWTIFNGKLQNTPISENADTSGRWISANCRQ